MASITRARARRAGRYGFRHATRMEWIKLRSLRATTWVLAAGVVATIALGAVAGSNTRNPHGDTQVTLPALISGAAGLVTAANGRPITFVGLTITGAKIVAIDLIDDPCRIAEADLAILGR